MNKFFKQFSKLRLVSLFLFTTLVVVVTFYFGNIFPIKYDQANDVLEKKEEKKVKEHSSRKVGSFLSDILNKTRDWISDDVE